MLRSAVAHRRSAASDLILGTMLAFVAGAINAGGFLAVGQYTSHMTGVVSSIADNLALGALSLVIGGLTVLASFIAGSGCSAVLINWGRRNARARQYAYPIALEAVLLLAFGALGSASRDMPPLMALAAPLLCFIMGLQNATITKISGARMRTTHLTGMVTDIGIEFGKLVYRNRPGEPDASKVRADRAKLAILLRVVGMFFLGGVSGALGFGVFGYVFCLPLSVLLLIFALSRFGRRPPRRAVATAEA
jgi:uncharacterized membrane protein YoaK (UPF0700 family)